MTPQTIDDLVFVAGLVVGAGMATAFWLSRWPEPQRLPGWQCGSCRGWNGEAKELLTSCRACGASI